jgi:holo-[acyl-carrier protein] synthase
MILRTGVDLIEIHRLEELNPAIRERFLQRVFTPGELDDAGGAWASLAGRFAAKEAVAKALGSGIGPVAWRDIEIRSGEQGAPQLILHGSAFQTAEALGLHSWSVSISHTRGLAVAMVVATA